jgi:hypothetical protein
MATRALTLRSWSPAGREAVVSAAYALGALAIAGEGVVHVQQYFSLYHDVSWIGPLFLVNGAACLAVIAGIAYEPTRLLAALAGIVISAVALGSLVISYGEGLFGWQEVGFRTPVALVLIVEVGAVILLSAALATKSALQPAPRMTSID